MIQIARLLRNHTATANKATKAVRTLGIVDDMETLMSIANLSIEGATLVMKERGADEEQRMVEPEPEPEPKPEPTLDEEQRTVEPKTFTTLDFPGAAVTYASGINDAGQIVGAYEDADGRLRGFLFDGTRYRALDFPGARSTFAIGINDVGQIVGLYGDADGRERGFLFDGTRYQTLDFPGARVTFAIGINDAGQIVGWYEDADGRYRGFLFDGTRYQTLDFPGAAETYAGGINDAGQIVGWYKDVDGRYRGFHFGERFIGGVMIFAPLGTSIEGTYVLVEGDFATALEEISFKDGTVTMKMRTFITLPGVPTALPEVHYEVRGRTIYIGYSGAMTAMFEIIDADTIQSVIPGFAGVFKRR